MKIDGPIFAIVTPFNKSGDIHFKSLGEYLDFLQTHGVKNIITGGTTGEFASLDLDERMAILEYCRTRFQGRIIHHVSSCCVKDCRTLMDHAVEFADAALVLPPFYYADVGAAGILSFFEEVLEHSKLPVYLYNFPRHTNNRIEPETLGRLGDRFECLSGIKDSGGDFSLSQAYKKSAPEQQVFVGGDTLALKVLESGLDGSVTGAGNVLPECLVGLYHAFMKGDLKAAKDRQEVSNIWSRFRKESGVAEIPLIKAGLRARMENFPVYTRPPLPPPAEDIIKSVARCIREIKVDS